MLFLLSLSNSYVFDFQPKVSDEYATLLRPHSGRISIFNHKRDNLEKDYSTTDLNSIVDQISNDFHLENERVAFYFGRTKHAKLSKQVFYRIDFNQRDRMARSVYLAGTVFKVTKENGVYNIKCRQARITGSLQAIFSARKGDLIPNDEPRWVISAYQQLTGEQITQVYNLMYKQIEGQLNAYKSI